MFSHANRVRHAVAAIALAIAAALAVPAFADALHPTEQEVIDDIKATIGGVPTFVTQMPPAARPGFWTLERDLELGTTALDAKTKALISLAVAAQIPCQYCVWADTNTLKQLGATDEEIGEAVSIAALTRFSSTAFNGLQVDFEQFKAEMGGGR